MKDIRDFDEKLLLSRAQDSAEHAIKYGTPHFLPFLSDTQQAFLEYHTRYPHDDERLIFYGGYDDADYKCAGFFPEYLFYDENYSPDAEFPLCAVMAKGSGFRKLSHRDFLGSMMSLGIKREVLGDIVVSEDGFSAVVFCLDKTADYLISNFTSAANDRIVCTLCDSESLTLPERKFTAISSTVSALRIDAVLSACLDISREEADRLLRSGFVSRNHIICTEKSKICSEGDLFSVRHHGRFLLSKVGDRNRRDRIRITLHKFI